MLSSVIPGEGVRGRLFVLCNRRYTHSSCISTIASWRQPKAQELKKKKTARTFTTAVPSVYENGRSRQNLSKVAISVVCVFTLPFIVLGKKSARKFTLGVLYGVSSRCSSTPPPLAGANPPRCTVRNVPWLLVVATLLLVRVLLFHLVYGW